jgi:Bacterial protein of unknown function (DUF937)
MNSVKLYDVIRAAGGGEVVGALAHAAELTRDQADQALRILLPDLGRAVRRTAESRTGAPAVHAVMRDERYARYLEDPEALLEPAAAEDGERVLMEVLDESGAKSSSAPPPPRSTSTRTGCSSCCGWSRPSPWPRSPAATGAVAGHPVVRHPPRRPFR